MLQKVLQKIYKVIGGKRQDSYRKAFTTSYISKFVSLVSAHSELKKRTKPVWRIPSQSGKPTKKVNPKKFLHFFSFSHITN
jgi:hypothetical protein